MLAKRRRLVNNDVVDRIAQSALDSGVSARAVIRGLEANNLLESRQASIALSRAQQILNVLPQVHTPFGELCQTKKISGPKGDMSIYYACLAAFLFHAMSISTIIYIYGFAFNPKAYDSADHGRSHTRQ